MKRYEIINKIILISSDEFETVEEALDLARLTKKELRVLLKHIEKYEF